VGKFRYTIASQAMGAFRHRFLDEKILVLPDTEITEMERRAYFGARCECGYIGKLPEGEYVRLDVNSMYPYVMRGRVYPTKVNNVLSSMSVESFGRLLLQRCAIADVYVCTSEPLYPYRQKKGVIYPVGKFWTTLCTGSLLEALKRGDILQVGRVQIYWKGQPFVSYVDYFLKARECYCDSGMEYEEMLSKLFGNALYGKVGQRVQEVVYDEYTEDGDFWREDFYSEVEDEEGYEEHLFHRHRVVMGKKETAHSIPSIAAHITDYARLLLWDYIDMIGWENVLYWDTDSILIKASAASSYDTYLGDGVPGFLKVDGRFHGGHIYGKKSYELDGEITASGLKPTAVWDGSFAFTQDQIPTMDGLLRIRSPHGVPKHVRKYQRRGRYFGGLVRMDGKVTPWDIDENIDVMPVTP